MHAGETQGRRNNMKQTITRNNASSGCGTYYNCHHVRNQVSRNVWNSYIHQLSRRRRGKVYASSARVASVTTSSSSLPPTSSNRFQNIAEKRKYLLLSIFPLRPIFSRATVRNEVVRGKIWTFEQPHGLILSRVTVNIRMTVVKLESGGLLVYCPIAPTEECISLLKEIGNVEHIILPTFAIEHKVVRGYNMNYLFMREIAYSMG